MSNLLEKIQSILQSEDVEGLIALGAPADEYSHEAKEIASILSAGENITEANANIAVVDVWKKCFGPFSEEEISKRLPTLTLIVHKIIS